MAPSFLKRSINVLATLLIAAGPITAANAENFSLSFDATRYEKRTDVVNGTTIAFRAYENIVYVRNPVDLAYQTMNIYIPSAYFEGKSVGGFTADTAPIFFPNSVGGYMPGAAAKPGSGMDAETRTIAKALASGFVVAAPGARGRTLTAKDGSFTGKAPAAIVDLKAAVRYLRYNDKTMPGNAERIVSNGTSAGGALSALLGATGNNADYEPYLKAIGAAETRDDIWAVSAYCPITNLDNADSAYEWLLGSLKETKESGRAAPPPGMTQQAGTGAWGAPKSSSGLMTAEQLAVSAKLVNLFPPYVNGLSLQEPDGTTLTLASDGTGTFRDYLKTLLLRSAQNALDAGTDLSKLSWVTVKGGKAIDIDWQGYLSYCGRKKAAPAFDGFDLSSGENNEFGTNSVDNQHFTAFGKANDTAGGSLSADPRIVKMMNPMYYVGAPGTTTAPLWRIRHGTLDSDTALAIPAILAAKLANAGYAVDFALPWDRPHSGDYDLDELFAWIAKAAK